MTGVTIYSAPLPEGPEASHRLLRRAAALAAPQLTDLPEECVYHLRRPESTQSGGATELVTVGNRSYRTRVSA